MQDHKILTCPISKLSTFGDYIFSRENKVQTFVFRVQWLRENTVILEGLHIQKTHEIYRRQKSAGSLTAT